MKRVYACPHCRTQNFITPQRLRRARAVPLKCWKCGREISASLAAREVKGRGERSHSRSKDKVEKA